MQTFLNNTTPTHAMPNRPTAERNSLRRVGVFMHMEPANG